MIPGGVSSSLFVYSVALLLEYSRSGIVESGKKMHVKTVAEIKKVMYLRYFANPTSVV